MNLENPTDLAAELFSGPTGPAELTGVLVVKGTWEVAGGRLVPAREGRWPIQSRPLETPYGAFPPDGPLPRPKVDLIVLGRAKAPGGRPVASMRVSVSVGAFRHELAVCGDRVFERRALGIRISEPRPFVEMPLTWANAFGGRVVTELGEMSCGDNPDGKGFVLDVEDADGVPLPNVEDPRDLLRAPGEVPRVAGWGPYPITGGLRLTRLVNPDGSAPPAGETEPLVMNWAHPDLMLDAVAAGETVTVEGVTGGPPVVVPVPACPFRATLVDGRQKLELTPRLDTLVVETDGPRLTARWRAAATFEMRPRVRRSVVLGTA